MWPGTCWASLYSIRALWQRPGLLWCCQAAVRPTHDAARAAAAIRSSRARAVFHSRLLWTPAVTLAAQLRDRQGRICAAIVGCVPTRRRLLHARVLRLLHQAGSRAHRCVACAARRRLSHRHTCTRQWVDAYSQGGGRCTRQQGIGLCHVCARASHVGCMRYSRTQACCVAAGTRHTSVA